MFETATNREEYFKLLDQKIFHIRKELENRKNQKPGANKSGDICRSELLAQKIIRISKMLENSENQKPGTIGEDLCCSVLVCPVHVCNFVSSTHLLFHPVIVLFRKFIIT